MEKQIKTVAWTKGPWKVYRHESPRQAHCCWAVGCDERGLMGIAHCLPGKEDAVLISKAPEMYDELFRALAVIRNPQAFDTEGVANDIERLLKEIQP